MSTRQAFRLRFRTVARQIWLLHVGRGVALTVLVAAAFVGAAATADYVFEMSRMMRAGLLIAGIALVAVLAAQWVVRPARTWDRARVAAELEGLFPRLGQRLRTATEHGGRTADELDRDGVNPGLVAALEEETAEKVKPLPFQAALPLRRAMILGAVAMVCVAAVVAVAAWVPEWRVSLARIALAPNSYTALTATASADAVSEGSDVEVRATMSGRARPAVVLHLRAAGESEWRQETMEPTDGEFVTHLLKLRETTEYFVVAGPERTPIRQIVVRHALKLVAARVEVVSPAYTGVPLANHASGDFAAIHGSTARLRFELDRTPTAATLVIKDPAKPTALPRRVEMGVQGKTVLAELPLAADMDYSIEAHDTDGMPLTANRYRVRVTADQPPLVWFIAPGEGLEVHTLAEVLIRARARDDFGLTKIGIVFQINNEEERTLVIFDVTQPHQREASAEQVLLLEQYLLTQKDCVGYYAFAEDARPNGPQRTVTDLRFIDIRPFQRTYRLLDMLDEPGNGPQRELILLDEVIARQRFNLNRSIQLERHSKVRLDLAQVEQVAAFENKLATQTHELADFLTGLGIDGAAILAQAEEAMLAAVDSLNGVKFVNAINQQRDALRYLMEARDTAQLALPKQTPKVRSQVRQFDRLQRQKLRQKNEQAEALAQLAGELAKLADEEDEVARDIKGPASDPTADPARERQDDIAGRATATEKFAATTKGLTPLAQSRIADATKAANTGADALGRGDRPAARKDVDRARELFRAAAKQVAALAAMEAALQLAAARDLANEIAAMTTPTDTMTMPGLGSAAEQAKTLKDVLENLAANGTAGEAARKAADILKQEDLAAAIARLEKPGAGADKGERQDLTDRFAALGQKLDQAYREVVAPRLEEIAKLEREANDLEQRAGTADDEADWRRLRQQAGELVERLEAAGLGQIAEELRAALKGANGPAGRELFGRGIATTHAKLVAKLQEFVATDRTTPGNEAVPPEYKDLVEQYLRALSRGGSK